MAPFAALIVTGNSCGAMVRRVAVFVSGLHRNKNIAMSLQAKIQTSTGEIKSFLFIETQSFAL